MMALWRCEICGDPYIGEKPPANCPFCGANKRYIKEAKKAKINFDVRLMGKDRVNAERALQLEISNSAFYFCASNKTDNNHGKILFKALGKIEAEHASIWKKILKLNSIKEVKESCLSDYRKNLRESRRREARAINFYRQAALESIDKRLKQIFRALVEIEKDHLELSNKSIIGI